jgi:hypothetical protein
LARAESSRAHHRSCGHRDRRLEHLQGDYFSSEALDEAYVLFVGTFGATWDDAMVAC